MKTVNVVAAIIYHEDKYLCVQRPISKFDYISQKYEFPGGKVEAGETEQQGIIREIQEELRMQIQVESKFMVVNHCYPDFAVTLNCYKCSVASKDLVLMEHIDYKWLTINELDQLDWAAADIPVVHELIHNDQPTN